MVIFFEDLSVIGWLGVVIWVALPVLIFIRQEWFFNYYERVPKLNFFEEICYTYERQVVFMAIRFITIVLLVIMVGKVLTAV